MIMHPVVILEYDSRWPLLFEEEKAHILAALPGLDCTIEHVGSTSVPGLAAKPIIDIMIGIAELDQVMALIAPLAALGYEYCGDVGIPGNRFFRKGEPRSHHLHVFELNHPEYIRHLVFRDYLRTHSEAAQEYELLKRALAQKYPEDSFAYTMSKTEFVKSVEKKASGGAQ